MDGLTSEPSRPVRRAVVSLVASLGKLLLPSNQWPELWALLHQCATMIQQQQQQAGAPGAASSSSPPAAAAMAEEAMDLAMVLVRELTKALGGRAVTFAQSHFKPLIAAALSHTGPASASLQRMRGSAIRALGGLLRLLEKPADIAAFQDTLPALVELTQRSLASGDEDAGTVALEVVGELLEDDSPLVKPYTEPLFRFLVSVFACPPDAIEDSTRSCAAEAISSLMHSKPKTVAKKGLVALLVPQLFQVMLAYDPEDQAERDREAMEALGVEADDVTIDTPFVEAGRLLDQAACVFPGKAVFGPASEIVAQWLAAPTGPSGAGSNAGLGVGACGVADWSRRCAALVGLTRLVNGCTDLLLSFLPRLLALVLPECRSPSSFVRLCAVQCLCEFTEKLHPRIQGHHGLILPVLLGALADPDSNVVQWTCFALDCYTSHLPQETLTATYLDPIMSALAATLSRPELPLLVAEAVLEALCSAVMTAADRVLPYAAGLMAAVQGMLANTEPKALRLRSRATECAGRIAVAVGKEVFAPYLPQVLASAAAGLQFQFLDLTQSTYVFYGLLAECVGPGQVMGDMLPGLVEPLFATIGSREELRDVYEEDEDASGVGAAIGALESAAAGPDGAGSDEDEEDGDDDKAKARGNGIFGTSAAARDDDDEGAISDAEEGDDEEDYDDMVNFRVYTPLVDVKEAAIQCLGRLAVYTGAQFVPFAQRSLDLLYIAAGHFQGSVRAMAVTALQNVVSSLAAAYPPTPSAHPATIPAHMPDVLRGAYDRVLLTMIEKMRDDDDLETVACCCSAVQRFCADFGLASVVNHHHALMEAILLLLREKAPCQLAQMEYDDEEGTEGADEADGEIDNEQEGDEDHDHVLIDEVIEAVLAIARATGDAFSHYAPKVTKAVLAYTRSSRTAADRLMVIGYFGDLVSFSPAVVEPFLSQIIPKIVSSFKDESPYVRRNCCFTSGIIIEKCPHSARPFIPALLQCINAEVTRARGDEEEDSVLDNAAGAAARVALAFPDMLPLSVALPAALRLMPTRSDHSEAKILYTFALGALSSRKPEAMVSDNFKSIFAVSAAALAPESHIASQDKTMIATGLRSFLLSASDAEKAAIRELGTSLPANQRDALAAVLTSQTL
jgi:hypothetical protein